MRLRFIVTACALSVVSLSCGGTPTTPSPSLPVTTPPVVNNTPPLIVKFTAQGLRPNEPPNFADLTEEVPISVDVTDLESSVNDLKFNWSATVGSFSGTGPKVVWKAPASAATPVGVTLELEVVETYTSAGKATENRVTGSTTVSLHDSNKEVSDIARQFLLDFSDSSIRDVPYIMRNFEPTCYGTTDETGDVTKNRTDFTIMPGWRVELPVTSVAFGGSCPFRAPTRPGDACSQIRTFWKSTANRDLRDPSGALVLRQGQTTTASGVDQVAAKYYKDQGRWRLCASDFNGDDPPQTSLRALLLRGLVP
jgi:hypothetical protein